MTPDEKKPSDVPLREHLEALRAADQRYYDAMRAADEKFDRERDNAIQKATDSALVSMGKATEVLAQTYKADKAQQNEWRGAINDIISKMGGARNLWAAIAATIALGFLIWNGLKSDDGAMVPAPVPVTVEQSHDEPVPVKEIP